jgi:hypothetical protein
MKKDIFRSFSHLSTILNFYAQKWYIYRPFTKSKNLSQELSFFVRFNPIEIPKKHKNEAPKKCTYLTMVKVTGLKHASEAVEEPWDPC